MKKRLFFVLMVLFFILIAGCSLKFNKLYIEWGLKKATDEISQFKKGEGV